MMMIITINNTKKMFFLFFMAKHFNYQFSKIFLLRLESGTPHLLMSCVFKKFSALLSELGRIGQHNKMLRMK